MRLLGRLGDWLNGTRVRRATRFLGLACGAVAFVLLGGRTWLELLTSAEATRSTWAIGLGVLAIALVAVSYLAPNLASVLPWVLAVLAYAALVWLLIRRHDTVLTKDRVPEAVGVVSVLFLVVVAILMVNGALADALSTRTSSASAVILLWSGVVVYAIAFIAAGASLENTAITCSSAEATNCIDESAWSDYLILLGVPGAAAAIAKAEKNSQELTESSEATNQISEVQYFVFNILAMLVVLGGLVTKGVLGEVPASLLSLTSASALTYGLTKRLPAASQGPDR